jgi:hypothetical protein
MDLWEEEDCLLIPSRNFFLQLNSTRTAAVQVEQVVFAAVEPVFAQASFALVVAVFAVAEPVVELLEQAAFVPEVAFALAVVFALAAVFVPEVVVFVPAAVLLEQAVVFEPELAFAPAAAAQVQVTLLSQ